jgi:hypothetical protein
MSKPSNGNPEKKIVISLTGRKWFFFLAAICAFILLVSNVSAAVIEFPTNQPGRLLRLVVTNAPGGLAVDRCGNIYYSDQGDGVAGNGKIVMIPKETNIPITILSGLEKPGDIELSPDERALIVVEDGDKIHRFFFGLSVQIRNASGALIDGLTVYVDIPGLGVTKGTKQMIDGFYHIPNLLIKGMTSKEADIVIEFLSGKTTRVSIPLGQEGEQAIFGQTVIYISVGE